MNVELRDDSRGRIDPSDFTLSFATRSGNPIRYYDDGFGPLWIYRDASGLIGIVRAQTWEDAWSIVEDEFLPVVPADAVYEAYGFDSQAEFDAADKETAELAEGYSYQSNATGTGVVYHDLNGELLDPLTVELCEQLELTMIVKI